MTFNDIYNQFIKSTKENFPVDVCIKQNERESNVFDSNVPYLCLVIDERFDNYEQALEAGLQKVIKLIKK